MDTNGCEEVFCASQDRDVLKSYDVHEYQVALSLAQLPPHRSRVVKDLAKRIAENITKTDTGTCVSDTGTCSKNKTASISLEGDTVSGDNLPCEAPAAAPSARDHGRYR